MKRIAQIKRTIAAILCCMMALATFSACRTGNQLEGQAQAESTQNTQESPETSPAVPHDEEPDVEERKTAMNEPEAQATDAATGKTRAALLQELAESEAQYAQSPDDADALLQYAQALFSLGNFEEAGALLEPLLKGEDVLPGAVYLAAQIDYLNGDYGKAEEGYRFLAENHYDAFGPEAEYGLQMVYYQTNEYSKVNELFAGQDHEDPMLDMMKAFGEDKPYQLNWNGKEETTIPFLVTDPLPVIPIEVNGVKLNALIDTGGNSLVLDETLVSALGVETIAKDVGAGGGGSTDIMWAKADTLKLGDVEIQHVPTMITPSSLFVGGYEKNGEIITLNAIIGTNIFQQFIPVMDYASEQLTLIPRSEAGRQHLKEMMAGEQLLEEVPFVLASSHFMYAKGSINGHTGMNMFVDTGLESEDSGSASGESNESIVVSKDTMELLGVPLPELKPVKGEGVLGNTDYEAGAFRLESYSLGSLESENLNSAYITSVSDLLSSMVDWNGFVCDALVSHHYVRQYKWIIDFDEMKMSFYR